MSADSRLLLGTAKIDITPVKPIPLAGFGSRSGPFEGVNRRLFVRVNVLEQEVDGAKRRLLIVQGDIIWWGSERMERIRATLAERFGIGPSDLILSAQHTHGGPSTSESFLDILGIPDSDYLQALDEALFSGVEQAIAGLEPVTAERGKGECRIGINRRKIVKGKMTMAPNPEGLLDPDVNVIRFRKESGATKAVFIHYSCHPTTTNSNYVTSEYPGVAAERLEATIGCGAVVSFLQGCTGNIRPSLHRDDRFYAGSEEDVARLGRALADEVERVLGGEMATLSPSLAPGKRVVVRLPFEELPTEDQIEAALAEGGTKGQWAAKLRSHPEKLRPDIPFDLTYLVLADGLSFLAMDGEVVLEYGDYIKRATGDRTLAMGYSNGMIGYVPTAAQITEGGYEGRESGIYFALPAAFSPAIEKVIKKAIDELIGDDDKMPLQPQPVKAESVDQLKVNVYANRGDLGAAAGRAAAAKIKELLGTKDRIRMIFAAAPSQNEFLETLVADGDIDWSRITAFHMDEYIGLPSDAPQKFSRFLSERLFDVVKPGTVNLIDSSSSIEAECARYGALLREAPIDIVCLGIGENGHIAFNDPPVADFNDPETIKPVELDDECRQQQVNDGCFPAFGDVPTHALTLTIPTLLSGSYLYCMVPGPTKRAAVNRTLNGSILAECPSTVLRRHPNCTLYVDRDSYGA